MFKKIMATVLLGAVLLGINVQHRGYAQADEDLYIFPNTETQFTLPQGWEVDTEDEGFVMLSAEGQALAVMDYVLIDALEPSSYALEEVAALLLPTLDEEAEDFDPEEAELFADEEAERAWLYYRSTGEDYTLELVTLRFENGGVGAVVLLTEQAAEEDTAAVLETLLPTLHSEAPITEGACVAWVPDQEATVNVYAGPSPTYGAVAEFGFSDGFAVVGVFEDERAALWWKVSDDVFTDEDGAAFSAWVAAENVRTRGDCENVQPYELPAPEADTTVSSAGSTNVGALWNVTFGSMSASCSGDTESAYVPETLDPTTVYIALNGDEMIFGDATLKQFAPNRYEGFLTLPAGDDTQVARIFIETVSETAYSGELTLNFNNNTCSATVRMTLVRAN
ncbi:MAG: hypothetical protein CUN55_00270 [Phototrophicales bacterium]|nr:MAG: hypothetical protein CUN55_00270 [Phototrophicales bacterium]